MVNRELILQLLRNPRFDIHHVPYESDVFAPGASTRLAPLVSMPHTAHAVADVHIRHRWPPNLSRPSSGKHVMFQPWEYGSLPVEWVNHMDNIDEVWVYTQFLKDCYARSGVPVQKLHVIQLGVDPELFRPEAVPMTEVRERAKGRFCFLYNGGLTQRKGADILVNAYLNEFKAGDNVCLVIKRDRDFYKSLIGSRIEALAKRTDIAPVIFIARDFEPGELPGLYTACDCYVHPYRAEGFGLPIAEAMACGLPAIVTAGGACKDFTNEQSCWYVPYKPEIFPQKCVGDIATVGFPFWLVPDITHLQQLMRYAFEHRDEVKMKGRSAKELIHTGFTWEKSGVAAVERIFALV